MPMRLGTSSKRVTNVDCTSFAGASDSITFQRPLNSSISAMSFRISGVMCGYPFIPVFTRFQSNSKEYPFVPIYTQSCDRKSRKAGDPQVYVPIVSGQALIAFLLSTTPFRTSVLLGKQGEQTGSHECSPPDQVEIEPSLTEKSKPELAIECPGDQACNGKIADRVDSCREHPCQWGRAQRHVTVAGHLGMCFDRAAAQQHR